MGKRVTLLGVAKDVGKGFVPFWGTKDAVVDAIEACTQ
jgi:hypothetical protein